MKEQMANSLVGAFVLGAFGRCSAFGGASGVGGFSPASLAGRAGFSAWQLKPVAQHERRFAEGAPSLRATKSRTFPPPLQVPKQFQQFFSSETRNCVRFSLP